MTLAAGADLRSTNRYGGTALIPACHHGHVETVRELLKTAIDGVAPLAHARQRRHEALAALLAEPADAEGDG